eukprot:3078339-Heterocapsa_arctica.AAC.1
MEQLSNYNMELHSNRDDGVDYFEFCLTARDDVVENFEVSPTAHDVTCNAKQQAPVFDDYFEDVQTTCDDKVKNFEVRRVAPHACGHQDGGRLNHEADSRTSFSASVKQSDSSPTSCGAAPEA